MRHSIPRHAGMAVFGAAGLAMGAAAFGQTALDANLSATQGRINPRATGIDQQIRYNNAVIHGSAPSGQSFRGSMGYQATNQFGGSSPSDTLYDFKRDSYTSGLAATGVRGSDAIRYQFSLATGENVPSYMASGLSSVTRAGTVARASSGVTGSALRSTSDFLTSQSYQPTLVGVRHDELGAEYMARASPLLGVAWVKTAESPLGVPGVTTAPIQPPATPVLPGAVPDQSGVKPIEPLPGTAAPAGTSAKPVINPFTGLETSARGVGSVLDRNKPGELDLRVSTAAPAPATSVHGQLETRFREGYDLPRATNPATPDKTVDEPVTLEVQMDRLHRMLAGKKELTADEKNPERAPDRSLFVPKPGPAKFGDKPKDTPETAPAPTVPAAPGAKPTPKDQNAAALDSLDALTPEFLRGLKKVQEKKIDHYVEPAPLAGADTSADPEAYKVLMREGETLMGQGRFFDAEDHFVRAIAGANRDPMARAARMHAQLGAGLYLSAATNLRAQIAAHPELTSTRYADGLLPSAERTKAITEQLIEQEKKYDDSALGRESALLLAYVGYQRGDQKLVSDGLGEFQKRIAAGEDGQADRTLLALVRAAWTTK